MKINTNQISILDLESAAPVTQPFIYMADDTAVSAMQDVIIGNLILRSKEELLKTPLVPYLLLNGIKSNLDSYQSAWEGYILQSTRSGWNRLSGSELYDIERTKNFRYTLMFIGLNLLFPNSSGFSLSNDYLDVIRHNLISGKFDAEKQEWRGKSLVAYVLDLATGKQQNIVQFTDIELEQINQYIGESLIENPTKYLADIDVPLMYLAICAPQILGSYPALIPILEIWADELLQKGEFFGYWEVITTLNALANSRLQKGKLTLDGDNSAGTNLPNDLQI